MRRPPTMAPPEPPQRRELPATYGSEPLLERRADWRPKKLLASFGYAFRGLWFLFSTQRNAQIHVLLAAAALGLGALLGLERWEWLALVITTTLVLAAEGINTAIEAAVDTATSDHHPLGGLAKDVGAGAVLICAIGSVVVGCIIFIPHLLALLQFVLTNDQ